MKTTKRAAYWLSLTAVVALYVAGCASPNPAFNPNLPADPVTNPQYIPNTTGTKVVETGQGLLPLVPEPYKSGLVLIFGATALTMGWIAKRKNDQATASNNSLTAVIKGVEAFTGPEKPSGTLKEIIEKKSKSLGTSAHLDAAVQKIT